jgi:hypothetical protein
MDPSRVDGWLRTVRTSTGRRVALRGLAAAVLGVGVASHQPDGAAAKKKPKIKRNQFGCVNVGDTCKNNGDCCSRICEGSKAKKTCKAHDTGGCRSGQDSCTSVVPCTSSTGFAGTCFTTTGRAGYCGVGSACTGCATDADCVRALGRGAACVQCDPAGCGIPITTMCKSPSPD